MSTAVQIGNHARDWIVVLFAVLLAGGCTATRPGADELAETFDFTRKQLAGESFPHIVFESLKGGGKNQALHVYIEGDGIPWEHGRFPAKDPTPRRALAMELMARDTAASIYVGRPCYFGLAESAGCGPDLWTSQRYSQAVVDSMAAVIRHYQQQYKPHKTVLIGYSGGGTIATLLATRILGEPSLLTIAANLDTQMWTDQYGLLPLLGSLNPVDHVEQLRPISQFHLMAGQDTTVPNNVTTSYTDKLPPGRSRVYPDFDHSCCWTDIWESVLLEKPWGNRSQEID